MHLFRYMRLMNNARHARHELSTVFTNTLQQVS